MLIARLAVAACALLVLVGCGVGHSAEVARQSLLPGTPTTTATTAQASTLHASEGEPRPIGDGVVLTVSEPTSFTPSDTAYPRVSRAVALEIVVDNGGTIPFQAAQLSFLATVDGAPTEQVIDSTQGYSGVSSTIDEVPPGQSLRFTVAFSVPERDCALRVSVQPDAAEATLVQLYAGMV